MEQTMWTFFFVYCFLSQVYPLIGWCCAFYEFNIISHDEQVILTHPLGPSMIYNQEIGFYTFRVTLKTKRNFDFSIVRGSFWDRKCK